jgi:hypothetical protein
MSTAARENVNTSDSAPSPHASPSAAQAPRMRAT